VIVHVLDRGFPLCGFSSALPCDWPHGHVWVSAVDASHAGEDVCAECAAEHEAQKAAKKALRSEERPS
jgi:hypothetical protein